MVFTFGSEANGRNASKVVMYEDVGKKQVHQFTAALRGCRSILQGAATFESCLPELSSNRLRDLLTTGRQYMFFVPMSDCILQSTAVASLILRCYKFQ